MNATSYDIKDMLEAESSLGLVYADDLYIGKEPPKPDNCVTIYDTPGFPVQGTLDNSSFYNSPSVQIRVRNKKYIDGMNLAQSIIVSLHNRAQGIWNGTLYTVIRCVNGPSLLTWDDNQNAIIVVNFNLQRR